MLQTLWVEPQRRISQSNRITINAAPMIQPRAELNRLSHSPLICGLDMSTLPPRTASRISTLTFTKSLENRPRSCYSDRAVSGFRERRLLMQAINRLFTGNEGLGSTVSSPTLHFS